MKFAVFTVVAALCGSVTSVQAETHEFNVTDSQLITVPFRAAMSGDEVGYESASVDIRYWFLRCFDTIVLQVELQRNSLHVGEWYRYEGERNLVSDIPPPIIQQVTVEATVTGPGITKSLRLIVAEGTPLTCFGDTINLGTVKELVGEKPKWEDVQKYLKALTITFRNDEFLRNAFAEDQIRERKKQPSSPSMSGMGAIVISSDHEDEKAAEEDDHSEDESESTSESKPEVKRTPTGFTNEQLQAFAFEAEGDRFAKLGPMFYPQALQQYRQAQALAPSASVQAKIDRITAEVAAAVIAAKAIDIAGEATETLVRGINGRTAIFKEVEAGCRRAIDGDGNACSLNFRYGRKVYALAGVGRQETQLRGSYYQAPDNDMRVAAREVAWRTTYLELGVGLALRFWRHFDFKLEGVMASGVGSWQSERTSEEASFDETSSLGFDWGYRFGLSVEVPRTPLALTVFYKVMASRFDEMTGVGSYERAGMRTWGLQINPGSISDLNYIGVGLVLRGRKP